MPSVKACRAKSYMRNAKLHNPAGNWVPNPKLPEKRDASSLKNAGRESEPYDISRPVLGESYTNLVTGSSFDLITKLAAVIPGPREALVRHAGRDAEPQAAAILFSDRRSGPASSLT